MYVYMFIQTVTNNVSTYALVYMYAHISQCASHARVVHEFLLQVVALIESNFLFGTLSLATISR